MIYLFIQTWIWILLAGLLGLFIGWLIWGRNESVATDGDATLKRELERCKARCAELENATPVVAATQEAPAAEVSVVEDAWRPVSLSGPQGAADDLKRIKGVGPVIEKTLNELGIYHFSQVAEFTTDNVKWVDNYIDFPGRIDREDWVSQSKLLAQGGNTEFSNRYDDNET